MNDSSLSHKPAGERWEFDAEVTRVFDDMLERSIPQYQTMRSTVARLAVDVMKPLGGVAGTRKVVDLGCSRGEAIATIDRLAADEGVTGCYVGLEVSEPMVAAARDRFAGEANKRILHYDLRDSLMKLRSRIDEASVFLSVLTLQFVPIDYRLHIIAEACSLLRPGGALIVVEKVLGSTAKLDRLFVDAYLRSKRLAGYGPEEILRKKAALEGVLVPVTAGWNAEMLRQAGFRHVDCFWRWMNFAGWIAVK